MFDTVHFQCQLCGEIWPEYHIQCPECSATDTEVSPLYEVLHGELLDIRGDLI